MKVLKFLKMKKQQKYFLLVWIPVMLIVISMFFATVGTHVSSYKRGKVGGTRIYFEKTISFEDTYACILIVIFLSFALYFMIGLCDIKNERKK